MSFTQGSKNLRTNYSFERKKEEREPKQRVPLHAYAHYAQIISRRSGLSIYEVGDNLKKLACCGGAMGEEELRRVVQASREYAETERDVYERYPLLLINKHLNAILREKQNLEEERNGLGKKVLMLVESLKQFAFNRASTGAGISSASKAYWFK